jgi:hypothetical protein
MPNWCDNILKVRGPKRSIAKFKAKAHAPKWTQITWDHKLGEDTDLETLKAIFAGPLEEGEISVLSFHALRPVPDYLRRLPYSTAREFGERLGLIKKLEGVCNGLCSHNECGSYCSEGGTYYWALNNWGCKSEAWEELCWQECPNSLEYHFQTPWCPPLDLFEFVTKEFPLLEFALEYEEFGMEFAGMARFKGGKCFGHLEWKLEHYYNDDESEDEDSENETEMMKEVAV